MRHEIRGMFRISSNRYLPCGLNIWQKLWWRFMPGEVINVEWPKGKIVVDHNDPRWIDLGGAVWVEYESTDPNDHYRPWMEEHVGKQGWDWNWGMADNDVVDGRLTIKFRHGKEAFATIALLMWS